MGDHYFTAVPSAPSSPVAVELRLPDMELQLVADRGVFSGGRVDPGTMALLKESPPPPVIGRTARPRLRLRADRLHARPAVAGGAGLGRRRQHSVLSS